ncbi:14182_t:CDS:2 [Cetraspora pellucida]|uniref:14182_t:CDS:1 n=1 Tax=Cetraspora pellucida TaxID=1433469 RepID=A0ACA9N488_9GLOM|nr:14182_t:CDS:2 [Cetraspora pellucida]
MLRAEHDINERIARTSRHNVLNRVINAKRPYDFISMIFEGEMPIQWGCHVRITLQELIGSEGSRSTFYQ